MQPAVHGERTYADTPRKVAAVLTALRVCATQEQQDKYMPRADYATAVQGTRIFPEWRRQVMQWLQEVGIEFKVDADTTATAANFFDRVMSAVRVPASQLQTAALACLFIAAKMADTPARLRMSHIRRYFAEICKPEEIAKAELNILYYLRWDVNSFTPVNTIRTMLQLVPDPEIQAALCAHAIAVHNVAMLDYDLLQYPPFMLGISCLVLVCNLRGFDVSPLVDGLSRNGVSIPKDPSCDFRVAALYAQKFGPPQSGALSPGASTLSYDTPRSLVISPASDRDVMMTDADDVGAAAALEPLRRSLDAMHATDDEEMEDEVAAAAPERAGASAPVVVPPTLPQAEAATLATFATAQRAVHACPVRTSRAASCVSTLSVQSARTLGDRVRSLTLRSTRESRDSIIGMDMGVAAAEGDTCDSARSRAAADCRTFSHSCSFGCARAPDSEFGALHGPDNPLMPHAVPL